MVKIRIRKMETKKVKRDKAVLSFLEGIGTEGVTYAFSEQSYMFDSEGLIDSLRENIEENMRLERAHLEDNINILENNLQEAGYKIQRGEDSFGIDLYILRIDEDDVRIEDDVDELEELEA